MYILFFFFNDTATTEIYTLSLHDALPICLPRADAVHAPRRTGSGERAVGGAESRGSEGHRGPGGRRAARAGGPLRSEEHTSELQSRQYLVCRLLLDKKKSRSRQRQSYRPL